jgi:hypothetical protein
MRISRALMVMSVALIAVAVTLGCFADVFLTCSLTSAPGWLPELAGVRRSADSSTALG